MVQQQARPAHRRAQFLAQHRVVPLHQAFPVPPLELHQALSVCQHPLSVNQVQAQNPDQPQENRLVQTLLLASLLAHHQHPVNHMEPGQIGQLLQPPARKSIPSHGLNGALHGPITAHKQESCHTQRPSPRMEKQSSRLMPYQQLPSMSIMFKISAQLVFTQKQSQSQLLVIRDAMLSQLAFQQDIKQQQSIAQLVLHHQLLPLQSRLRNIKLHHGSITDNHQLSSNQPVFKLTAHGTEQLNQLPLGLMLQHQQLREPELGQDGHQLLLAILLSILVLLLQRLFQQLQVSFQHSLPSSCCNQVTLIPWSTAQFSFLSNFIRNDVTAAHFIL